MPFYNCHMHIFSADCAPEHFLKIGGNKILTSFSGIIKAALETRWGRWITHKLSKINSSNPRLNRMARYGAFASIGTMATQRMVFRNILPFYPPGSRFVVLTLNMDYMGAGKAVLSFQGQIDQVIALRREYPDACLPFLSIDPRMDTADGLLAFVKKYVGEGKPFVGIKLYPALGYFPYDIRLKPVYKYCEDEKLPIMTHCDPGGNFFLGTLDAIMGIPGCITHGDYCPPAVTFDPKLGNNLESDKFLEPHTWDVVLANFPDLKICFAHMGGSDAIAFLKSREDVKENEVLPEQKSGSDHWYSDILEIMAAYPKVYTDVSYTLHDKANHKTIQELLHGEVTSPGDGRWNYLPPGRDKNKYQHERSQRLIFGTDYFMTEREKPEKMLAKELPEWLIKNGPRSDYEALTEENPKAFLESSFYKP